MEDRHGKETLPVLDNDEAIFKGLFRIKEVEAGRTLGALSERLDEVGIPAEAVLSVRYRPARSWRVDRRRPSFRVVYRP
jgi:hypothetical protein